MRDEPITQYEGHVLWDNEIANLASTSHVASPTRRGPHINGFRAINDTSGVHSDGQEGERSDGLGGIPITCKRFRGFGGASMANAQSEGYTPNAKFFDWKGNVDGKMGLGDSTARFLVALRDIQADEFIIADYKSRFLRSSKCKFTVNSANEKHDNAFFSNASKGGSDGSLEDRLSDHSSGNNSGGHGD